MHLAPFIKGLVLAACLSALGVFFQSRHESWKCSLDGSVINPVYEVEILGADETVRKFSCIQNARIWLERNVGSLRLIRVTDETTQQKVTAEKAFYVLSTVVTTAHTGNRIHAFASLEAALSHARQFDGVMVANPLRVSPKKPTTLASHPSGSPNDTGLWIPSCFKLLCLGDNPVPRKTQILEYIRNQYPGRFLEGHEKLLEKPPEAGVPVWSVC